MPTPNPIQPMLVQAGPTAEEPEIVVGSREQLFHLLAEAAEVEHSLMCSYLYALFSLKQGEADGLSGREAEAVARWRRAILAVATDEMVHLLLVANLSIAVGSRPHFGRPNFPVAPGYFPSGLVVKLTPFSEQTLEHFIFVERPRGFVLQDGEGFEHEEPYVREEAYHGLMPSIQEYATVGHLYQALLVNLTASARRLGERGLFIGPIEAQIGPDAVALDGVMTVSDLRSARRAIATIIEQGEGSQTDRTDSHYHRFLAIQDEFSALRAENPSFAPAWPAAHNPVMRRPPEPQDKIFVDAPAAARLLDFSNAVYALIVRFLVQACGRRAGPEAAADQAAHVSAAIGLMHVLGATGAALARLPASAEAPGQNAGMTFTMLRSVDPLFRGEVEDQLVAERLRELVAGARTIARDTPALAGVIDVLATLAAQFEQRRSG